ncbi:MAG TPA: hypothetical protein VJJ98_05100 [Sedimentisphaerales bacterium]|nr:hypothetical protein [Sedimentisphaerales bacterium]
MMINLDKEMAEQGYIVGIPETYDTSDHSIEAQLCADYACEICGSVGLRYRPFFEHHSQAFRTFAECPNCGWAEEL